LIPPCCTVWWVACRVVVQQINWINCWSLVDVVLRRLGTLLLRQFPVFIKLWKAEGPPDCEDSQPSWPHDGAGVTLPARRTLGHGGNTRGATLFRAFATGVGGTYALPPPPTLGGYQSHLDWATPTQTLSYFQCRTMGDNAAVRRYLSLCAIVCLLNLLCLLTCCL
jgi:hypothetical protein